MISVVIPVYNEGISLIAFCEEIISCIQKTGQDYELILVDDRSTDDSWTTIKNIAESNEKVISIRLIRNFGQHSALTVGLEYSSGEFAILMDCDGQDDPEYIIELYEKIKLSSLDVIYAKRQKRKGSIISRFGSVFVNYIFTKLSGINFDSRIGTYRIISRKAIDAYLSLPEKRRYFGGLFFWLGFQSDFIEVIHRKRGEGKSTYSILKRIQLTRIGLLNSSTKLLSLGTYLGILSGIISFLSIIYFIYMKLVYDVPLGYTSIIISIFFVGSILMILLGIIGEYLSEIYYEVKGRPNYIVDEVINKSRNG
jgi:glycosyltransferase involved in cell wall biosynthesis